MGRGHHVDATDAPHSPSRDGRLLAVSDLHVRHDQNRDIVRNLRPGSPDDWLLVAGDVGESVADVTWALRQLRDRFARVIWVPGNHELWTAPGDPEELGGERKYRHLVDVCRTLGIDTPEDPYPVWHGAGGPAVIVPLFLLYDYSFRPPGAFSKAHALRLADEAGVVCTDEFLLSPAPYPSREAWCRARIAETLPRLDALPDGLPTVLVNHFPLVRDPLHILRHPEFALWCGTTATADWHLRYRAAAVVYGHLHIPRTLRCDGVPHHEVSLGYPREWQRFPRPAQWPVPVLGSSPVAAPVTIPS
ncbi:metallophosphoesterase family protein [Streptomyces luteogriseus]|uniref:metallophosphoesterase family protein n=1 Tax=Streptomyces luteogriseus TaxID=68233 RepID=UPI003695E3DC